MVIDKRRSAKGGRAVEELGYVNPLTKKNALEKERVLYWISKGAKPSPRVHNLLVAEKVIDAPKINVFKVKKGVAQAKPAPQINADQTQINADTKTEAPAPVAEPEKTA